MTEKQNKNPQPQTENTVESTAVPETEMSPIERMADIFVDYIKEKFIEADCGHYRGKVPVTDLEPFDFLTLWLKQGNATRVESYENLIALTKELNKADYIKNLISKELRELFPDRPAIEQPPSKKWFEKLLEQSADKKTTAPKRKPRDLTPG